MHRASAQRTHRPAPPSTPAGRCSPSWVLLPIPGCPLLLLGYQLPIPGAGPYRTSCWARSCTQRGSVPIPHPAATHCPAGTQKPCLCHGRLRRRLRGLPGWPGETFLAPSLLPQGWGGSPSRGKGGGSSKAPIEHRPPTASHSRDPPASLPYVPLRLCCWSGGKKGEKKNKNQLLPFNI